MAGAVRKPGSVPAAGCPATGGDHSSRAAVADGLKQPTRKHGRAALDASLLGLAPGGVYLASGVAAGPGELLPHPFTLTRLRQGFDGRTSLCGTFPGVAPAGRYPAPCPVEPGLSSPPKGAAVTWPAPAKPLRLRQKSICGVAPQMDFSRNRLPLLAEDQHPLAMGTGDKLIQPEKGVVKLGRNLHIAAET